MLTGVEIAGMWLRVIGLLLVCVMSIRLFILRNEYIWFLSGVTAAYHVVVYLEFIFNWGWSNRELVGIGYPFIMAVWIGLLLQCTRGRKRYGKQ